MSPTDQPPIPPGMPQDYYTTYSQRDLPVSHRNSTIHGLLITFQICVWAAVTFRIYCRTISSRSFGWDDFFIICALITTTITTSLIALMTKYGMGQHFGVVASSDYMLTGWYKTYFFFMLAYFLSATLIKLSILFQYLRLFKEPEQLDPKPKMNLPRIVCIAFIVLVSLWGAIFFLLQLLSCRPVSSAWSLSVNTDCSVLWSWDLRIWLAGFVSHAVTNMVWDYAILVLPVLFRHHLHFDGRSRLGMIVLLIVGGGVATVSAVRLGIIVAMHGGVYPSQDATWNAPAILYPTALEIQWAVVCASVPIFWPMIAKTLHLDDILVTREVILHSEARNSVHGQKGWKRQSSSETELTERPKYGGIFSGEDYDHGTESKVTYNAR